MEYERTPDGQIQVAFARRAGQLLLQYERLAPSLAPKDQFESTLALALLQSMLTICMELLNKKRPPGTLSQLAKRRVADEPERLGLEQACILTGWPTTGGLTYRQVFECLRNSLSHPGAQDTSASYPRTGFTTAEASSGKIEAYLFTHSPWVNNTGRQLTTRYAPTEVDDKSRVTLEQAVRVWASNAGVDGLCVEKDQQGLWRVFRQGSPFVPVLRLRLEVRHLRTLTLALSDELSPVADERIAIGQ